MSSQRKLAQSLEQQSARVLLETAKHVIPLAGELARPVACELAREVSRHVSRLCPEVAELPVIDAMDTAWLNSDAAERPADCDLKIEALPDGLHIRSLRRSQESA